MDCPVCKKGMGVLEYAEIEVDYCFSCKGIWLDAGELELLLEGGEDKDALLSSFKIYKDSKEKGKKCPICLRRMEKILCGKEKEVLIDKCKRNDGLWFDKDELENVLRIGYLDKDNRIINLLKDIFSR